MIYIFTGILLIILFLIDSEKTKKSIKIGFKNLFKQLPVFLFMSILVSVSLYFISDDLISKYLGSENQYFGMILASILGSISLIPGFIAFPLAGILLKKGVTYMVISTFTNTLMMVGIVSFPVEKKYFGVKIAIIRNIIGLIISICVSLIIGLVYKELI